MSLIKCPECGKEVSDKAEFCIHCGIPIREMNDCESIEKTDVIEETEVRDTKGIDKKAKISIGIGILAVVVIVALLLVNHAGINNKDLYNNIAWGSTYEETMKKVSGQVLSADEESVLEMVDDYNGYVGVEASILYDFSEDGTLHSVDIICKVDDESEYSAEELWDTYEEMFEKSFGEGEQQDVSYNSETWNTSKSEIHMEYFDYLDLANVLYLGYSDITTID